MKAQIFSQIFNEGKSDFTASTAAEKVMDRGSSVSMEKRQIQNHLKFT
jgi:hypothetical protein